MQWRSWPSQVILPKVIVDIRSFERERTTHTHSAPQAINTHKIQLNLILYWRWHNLRDMIYGYHSLISHTWVAVHCCTYVIYFSSIKSVGKIESIFGEKKFDRKSGFLIFSISRIFQTSFFVKIQKIRVEESQVFKKLFEIKKWFFR